MTATILVMLFFLFVLPVALMLWALALGTTSSAWDDWQGKRRRRNW